MAQTRRLGGRAARKALRDAPLAENIKPTTPGLDSGMFKPLSDNDLEKVNEAVIYVLDTIGLSQALPSCIKLVTAAGGKYIADKDRLLFPRALVEDTIANANRNIMLYGQDPKHDIAVNGSRTYFGTGGAAVHIVDVNTREYRDSTLQDLYDAARIVDHLEHIHFFHRPLVCTDLADPLEMGFNTCYAAVSGTTKHVGTSWVHKEHLDVTFQMLHEIAGGEKKWENAHL